ncbi:hypothetical protein EHP00_1760 [Ecytonucleospora hepatopenaei]|uniref:Uncharacterized protein n=1 Tax=Ecytonucleospora hepatopenaei TaxID=646526 RepID=A0A1W0E4K7_9MICR|nr:hypothetical protein EHP00_1760 [Ecytonucleospora hepatopenaei]
MLLFDVLVELNGLFKLLFVELLPVNPNGLLTLFVLFE